MLARHSSVTENSHLAANAVMASPYLSIRGWR